MSLDEENAQLCLDEFIYSQFGKAMFGVHDVPGTILFFDTQIFTNKNISFPNSLRRTYLQ